MDDYEYDYFMVRVRRMLPGAGDTGTAGEVGSLELGRSGETGPSSETGRTGETDDDEEAGETRQVALSGVAERLDTGEKHLFRNGAELLELMLGGRAGSKLRPDSPDRNDVRIR